MKAGSIRSRALQAPDRSARKGWFDMRSLAWITVLASSASLVACGGGGSGSSAATTRVALAAPATLAGSPIDGHFARLNEVRVAMGLPSLGWNDTLANAAQHHADYQRLNQVVSHAEIPGNPGFYGEGFGDRASRAGYAGSLVGEVIIGGAPDTVVDGRNLMDAMLSAPGHRLMLLAYEFSEVGMGSAPLTSDLGAKTPRIHPAGGLMLYPYSGQRNVATAYAPASESPNPLPGVSMTGMPLSIHAGLFSNFTVSRVSLTDLRSGTTRALLGSENIGAQRSAFVFFPAEALEPNSSYSFSADVMIDGLSRSVTSTFTTAGT
jgi:hypothetical protein